MRVRVRTVFVSVSALLLGLIGTAARAQDRSAAVVEVIAGDAGFVDEVWDHFLLFGGGARAYVTPRLAIGGEVAYMRGEFEASNLTFTGNMTFDLVADAGNRRVVPYLVVAGGMLRQRTIVGSGPGSPVLQPFTSSEGTVSGGVGARISLGSRAYVAPEFRFGWEPETRLTVSLGLRL